MKDSDKLRELRIMTDSNEDDSVLLSYLNIAKRRMLNRLYPFQDVSNKDIPARYEGLQLEIAAYLVNKRGAEGEVQHNENGISRTYGHADVPPHMLFELTPMCGIPE